jgi:ubiquinone/menaquinone biosynthesis C-methylase UbiE
MDEMKKSTQRRLKDNRFLEEFFVGAGIDIGCGHDLISKVIFTGISKVDGYDFVLGHKDAQTLPEIEDETYDFATSSHCLEHMRDPFEALTNWLRVIKSGGYLVVTIPDWVMYEHRQWPSKFNHDHKWAWTAKQDLSRDGDHVIYVPDFLKKFENQVEIKVVHTITDNYNYALPSNVDQTLGAPECAIEFVLRKK